MGSDRAYPLPSVSSKFGNISIPGEGTEDELETLYAQAQQLLKTKVSVEQKIPEHDIQINFEQFRTLIVAAWALSNGLLVFLILNYIGGPDNLRKVVKFVAFVLWSFAGLTGIKSTGALYYFVTQGDWSGDGGKRGKKRKTT